MSHRNNSNGGTDGRTFYLYGYSFNLNPAKTIQSIRVPNNPNVVVTAINVVPNWQPTFNVNPLTLANANAGQGYSGTVATDASDLNGDALTYSKVSGPAWLNVAANGGLSGVPANIDANTNSFVISATDSGGLSNTLTLLIYVNGAPSFTADPFTMLGIVAGQITPARSRQRHRPESERCTDVCKNPAELAERRGGRHGIRHAIVERCW